jgi:hypothetical protein
MFKISKKAKPYIFWQLFWLIYNPLGILMYLVLKFFFLKGQSCLFYAKISEIVPNIMMLEISVHSKRKKE